MKLLASDSKSDVSNAADDSSKLAVAVNLILLLILFILLQNYLLLNRMQSLANDSKLDVPFVAANFMHSTTKISHY